VRGEGSLGGLDRFGQGNTSLLVMVMEIRDVYYCGSYCPQIIISIDMYMEQSKVV
jgi:hypothetical protein